MIRLRLKKSRSGRPRLPAEHRRSLFVHINLSDKEYSRLRRRAATVGVPPLCFARDLALYATTPISCVRAIDPAAIGQLARVGNLLNQAMHRINAGRLAPEIRPILEDLYGLLTGLLHGLEVEPE